MQQNSYLLYCKHHVLAKRSLVKAQSVLFRRLSMSSCNNETCILFATCAPTVSSCIGILVHMILLEYNQTKVQRTEWKTFVTVKQDKL